MRLGEACSRYIAKDYNVSVVCGKFSTQPIRFTEEDLQLLWNFPGDAVMYRLKFVLV